MEKQYWKKMMENKIHYKGIAYTIGIVVLGILYFFILGDNGPYLMRDSEAFLNPTSGLTHGYWLYPRFLDLCEIICGQESALNVAYIIQGLLALITSIWITEYFRKYFGMGYLSGMLIYICTLLPYGYSLPENVVTHHIMTEAISIPLFYICILFSCKSFLEKKYYYMIFVVVTEGGLALSRSQLLVFLPVIAFLLVIIFIREVVFKIADKIKVNRRNMVIAFIVISVGLMIVFLAGVFMKTTIGSQLTAALSGRIMCLMEYEDRELFEGEVQEIYDALYKNADEGGHIQKYFRTDSWRAYDIADHTNENGKECLPVIRYFYNEKYAGKNMEEYALQSYYDRDYIMTTLLRNHIWDYVIMSLQLMTQSFVASVFIQPYIIRNLCYIITLFIYLGTFCVIYISDRKVKVEKKYIVPMLITLLFLVSNVVFTNAIFYGQQRYVIYTFGMFYISLFIMIMGIYRKRKELTESE